jgi:hypothetical protein
MDYSGSGTVVNLDSGYGMFYFDPYFAPQWFPSPPMPPSQIVQQLANLITDPNYTYPSMSGSLGSASWDDARTSIAGSGKAVLRADDPVDTSCATEAASVDVTKYTFMAGKTPDQIYCYEPGTYLSGSGAKNASIDIGTSDVGILKPGAYYLKSGMQVRGSLVGGFEAASPGVALMFDEAGPGNCPSCVLDGNNAVAIALNAGSKFPAGSSGVAASPAIDWDNQPVQTSGPASPNPPLLMTLLVKKDANCFVPTSAPFVEPTGCQDSKNQTISISGGGQLVLEGVQYMPTDNVFLGGSSDGNGTVGQIIAWTITYTGGTAINQEGPGSEGPGVLRLDAACTAPGSPCNLSP